MHTFLGIDAGGSGSTWALIEPGGLTLGDRGPSIQLAELGVAVAAERVLELCRAAQGQTALPEPPPTVVALAGAGSPDLAQGLAAALAAAGWPCQVVEDTRSAAAAALAEGPGVAIFAGTGSFAMARDAAGKLHRSGGFGAIVSDHGSGYWNVRAACEAAVSALDQLAPPTALGEALAASFGCAHAGELGRVLRDLSLRDVAARFPVVLEIAAAGDGPAAAVLDAGALGLARLGRSALDRAGLDPAAAPVTLGGGVTRAAGYRSRLQRALQDLGCTGMVRELPRSPAEGAAHLAEALALGHEPLASWCDG